jgi:hypothetical protein
MSQIATNDDPRYEKSDFMVLLPTKSVFKFTLQFKDNKYLVTPISNIFPYKYGGGHF